jgi:hypothetical protein
MSDALSPNAAIGTRSDDRPLWCEHAPADRCGAVIPTLLVLGLVLGSFVHDRRSAVLAATVVVAVSMVWGITVGLADDQLATMFGGPALGVGNLAVGVLVAPSFRSIAHWVKRSDHIELTHQSAG